ncbi:DUF4190 domain-containing protein [Kribbella speibonae]|uniref:DUF4190 domain-containing protein n=1 Tax=Kribbella speibonae TaxID=1572660 RepID=A0ABY1ZX55_9ACTN|nr:DUF4190 domain-containing protein [Kribbella speibonae]TCC19488.1 DUF4190 domain-containing protein [Kribbella speibonae]
MSQSPYGPEPERPQDRPQDRPHDPTRAFPTYGRPGQPEAPGAQGGTSWAPPGQSTYGQVPGGQAQAPYGQGYGPGQYPSAYGQAPGPYGYGYGYGGYGYSGSGGTNGLATAALVTGLGGFVIGVSAPVAIGLGIAALVQINRSKQEGKGMAIAGLVMGSLVTLGYTLLIVLVIALGASSDDDYSAPRPGSSNSAPTTYVDDLTVGECFDEATEEDEVIRQPCTDAHDAEVLAIPAIPGTTYPGDSAINKAADRACAPAFGTYVGKSRDQSELYLDWWTPSKEAWDDGDHRVLCAAFGPDDDKLTGSVKNSHR